MSWVSASHFFNKSALNTFTATWEVPPAPKSSDGQTIFIFNGFQASLYHTIPNSTRYGHSTGAAVLQPVLQWGEGGVNKWQV